MGWVEWDEAETNSRISKFSMSRVERKAITGLEAGCLILIFDEWNLKSVPPMKVGIKKNTTKLGYRMIRCTTLGV